MHFFLTREEKCFFTGIPKRWHPPVNNGWPGHTFKNCMSHICSLTLLMAEVVSSQHSCCSSSRDASGMSQLQRHTSASNVLCQPENSSDPTQPPGSPLVHRRRCIWSPGRHSRSLLLSQQPENAAHLNRKLNLALPQPHQTVQPACCSQCLGSLSIPSEH